MARIGYLGSTRSSPGAQHNNRTCTDAAAQCCAHDIAMALVACGVTHTTRDHLRRDSPSVPSTSIVPPPCTTSRMAVPEAGQRAAVSPAGTCTASIRNSGTGGTYRRVCASTGVPLTTGGAPVLRRHHTRAPAPQQASRHTADLVKLCRVSARLGRQTEGKGR